MDSLAKKCIILSFALLILIVSVSAAQFDGDGTDEYVIVDPPQDAGGDRIPVFLVMSDQPAADASVQTMKATAQSQQQMTMSALAHVDPVAAETARSHWIVNAIHVEAYPADLDRLAALPGVDHIERDYMVTVADPVIQTMDEVSPASIHYSAEEGGVVWSADFIDAPTVWETGNLGAGVNISIVDSGIDGSHPAFGDRIVAWADFVKGANETAYDDNGHGTHCAGTAAGGVVETTYENDKIIDVVLGIAPEANLMGAKVLDAGGSGSFSDIMDGVEWSVDNGADVISMSLGGFLGPWKDDFTDKKEFFTLNNDSSTSVTVEAALSYDTVYEPQFIVGAVNAGSNLIYEIEHGENLTFTLTGPGNTVIGSEIDWLGFDTSSEYYYFKAPYADNTGAWNGKWTATLTNAGEESVYITSLKIAVCYQSNGQDIESRMLNGVMNLGTTVVVSAGNDGEYGHGTIGVPGTAEDVITVGATDYMMDYRAPFSSIGPVGSSEQQYCKPDLVAPGVGIISAYMNGGYAILDGTSMSTPAVAGTAALMLAGNNDLTPDEVKDALMSSSVHIAENGAILDTMQKNSIYGAGRVNAFEAVNVTGGMGTTPIGDGVLYELFGGIVSEGSDVYSDSVTITAVTWNVTGGVPMADEDVLISVRNYYSPYEYVNVTVISDASGNALTSMDLSKYPDDTYMRLQIAWNDHMIEESFSKAATPTPATVGKFIYKSKNYWALTNDTIQIKYPLLNPDGSPYTDDVVLKLGNYVSEKGVYNETITPIAGVVATDIDLSTIYSGDEYSYYSIYLDDERAGYLQISSGVDEEWYNVVLSPGTAICSPGSSIDISAILVAYQHMGMTGSMDTGSTTATATVVSFGETEINSLTANTRNALLGGELKTFDELNSEIQGMDRNVMSETFPITNGIGLYTLDMPEDGYLALVYVTAPSMESYNEASVTVYGEITPWIRHSTTDGIFRNPVTNFTSIYPTTSEWRATWNQQTYSVDPAKQATLGFTVYTYTLDEVTDQFIGAPAAGETVYLYTMDGATTDITDVDGRCSFTVTPSEVGDAGYEYLAVTGGLDLYGNIYGGAYPLSPDLGTCIAADLITLEPVAPASHGYLRPDSATRSVAVVADNANRTITLTSVGPNDESIHEKGMFTYDQSGPYYYSNGTLSAATVEFDGTVSKRVEVPEMGTYDAAFSILNPVDGTLQFARTTFVDTDYNLTYEVMDDLLEGTSVPTTFTLTDQNGDPVSGAKVLFKMGAAVGWMTVSDDYETDQSEINPRDENVWPYLGVYPDPYSQIYTDYTDASGQVELTFTTPTAAVQAYRKEMGSDSEVYYNVICVHNDRFVAIDGGSYMPVADNLPDFVPSVDAPNIVKIHHNDTVKVNGLGVSVSNVGTADFIYSGTDGVVVAESGGYSENVLFNYNILKGTTEEVLYVNIEQSAQDYGIDPETTSLPQDTIVKVTVNPDKGIEELRYDNNVYSHTLRITAPDLVTEVIAPSTTTALSGETPIGVKVTNGGQVPSVATTLTYEISSLPIEAGISVIGLNPGDSTIVWKNMTLVAGEYSIAAEVNPGHATDYETSYTNNLATKAITSFDQIETKIVLPQDKVLVNGTCFELPIVVENVEELVAYQMTFAYNASVIEVTDVIPGDISLTAENLLDGYVIFNGAQTSSESGNVTIATLAIDVIGESGDETPFTLSQALLWDINEFALPLVVTDGSGYVLLYGDANDDGVVSQLDTLKVLKWVVGLDSGEPISGTTQMLQTDVTKNSHVDVGDAMFIAQFNVGLRDNYFNIP